MFKKVEVKNLEFEGNIDSLKSGLVNAIYINFEYMGIRYKARIHPLSKIYASIRALILNKKTHLIEINFEQLSSDSSLISFAILTRLNEGFVERSRCILEFNG